MEILSSVIVKRGKERQLRSRHPWLYSGAIERVDGRPEAGDVVRVMTHERQFLAYGFYNPKSQTSVRLVEWAEDQRIDDAWWHRRIEDAFRVRTASDGQSLRNEGVRIVHGEADGLPGVVCDLYGNYAVLQCTTLSAERNKGTILAAVREVASGYGRAVRGVYERSDIDVRELEGLRPAEGLLWGDRPSEPIEIEENGLRVFCSISGGQKGGYYFDQRENRQRVAEYAAGRSVLDAFCYTGAFSMHALRAGARHATLLDSSENALSLAATNLATNGFDSSSWNCEQSDVFKRLRVYQGEGRRFDLVVLDPPKLATSRSAIEGAMRAYKDLNLQAMKLLAPGGILATFSCSGRVSREQFQMTIAWAAQDAGRDALILETLTQSYDHPIRLSFPESEYLKGFILHIR